MIDQPASTILASLYRGDEIAARRVAATGEPLDAFEAAALGDVATLRGILAQTPDVARHVGADGFTALHLAAYFGTAPSVAALLEAGADPAMPARNAMLVLPLHCAASRRKAENVRALLDGGSPVDAAQQGGLTALHSAAHNGELSIVEMLLSRGADRNIVDSTGKSAAQHARDGGHAALASLLEAGGA
jgi:ankyrin repeat protein